MAVDNTGVKKEDGSEQLLYLKGMAVYDDHVPEGKDIVFYTNKHLGTPVEKVLKPMKDDPSNPFGASIKDNSTEAKTLVLAQRYYTDENGVEHQSCLNIVNEEGNWGSWSKTLSSQFLGKQRPELVKQQLDMTYDIYDGQFQDIMMLTNPAVKKDQLSSLSETLDGASVHLKAAGMPNQTSKVILPLDIEPRECYCPAYADGTVLALVRFPHGTIAEIPIVVVNNKNKEGRSVITNDAKDAIGISHKVSEQLSGADIDGDTVLAIPLPDKGAKLKTSKDIEQLYPDSPLLKLREFDPKEMYPATEGCKIMTEAQKQQEMGKVSNLITDMTIRGADDAEIAKAIKHSMVVIDAVKHKLDYEQSYIDNDIAALKEKYQGGENRGASTLLSRASSDYYVDGVRKPYVEVTTEDGKKKKVYIDPETGKKMHTDVTEEYRTPKKVPVKQPKLDEDGNPVLNKRGKPVMEEVRNKDGSVKKEYKYDSEGNLVFENKARQTKISKMEAVEDAFELSSGSYVESLYASYANKLKALADLCRKEMLACPNAEYHASAAKEYSTEVESLKSKLNMAKANAPLERHAQILANSEIRKKIKEYPDMTNEELKKVKNLALENARKTTGAHKDRVTFTEREWEAVQKGAVSHTLLTSLLKNADSATVKQLAMPREDKSMSAASIARATQMLRQGFTTAEVAAAFDVSVNILNKNVKR